jgi:hypothetical protein
MMCALGWSFVAITVLGCVICTGFALAACLLSARISREEEGDVFGAGEGDITHVRPASFLQPAQAERLQAFRQ